MDWGTISTRYYLFIVNTFVQCAALAFWIQLVHCHCNKGTCEMKISLQSIVLTEIVYNKIAFVLEKIGSLEWVYFLLLRDCKVFTCSLFGRTKDNMKTKFGAFISCLCFCNATINSQVSFTQQAASFSRDGHMFSHLCIHRLWRSSRLLALKCGSLVSNESFLSDWTFISLNKPVYAGYTPPISCRGVSLSLSLSLAFFIS